MNREDIARLDGEIRYRCPKCWTVNFISLEKLENYLDVYDVPISYSENQHTYNIELYSPICEKCGHAFVSYIKNNG